MKRIFALTLLGLSSTVFAAPFTLSSSTVPDKATLPALYTCDGKDVSPNFTWKNAPTKTQSFALILRDPEAQNGTYYHWVVYNIDKGTHAFAEGMKDFPKGVEQGKNTVGKMQYKGPCPPKGATHHYHVSVYALDIPPTLPAGYDHAALENAIQGHTLAEATYQFVFGH